MSASFPTRLRIPGTWNLDGVTCEPVAAPPDGHREDARLMLKVQAGDHKALAGLIDRYSGIVFEIGRQVLRGSIPLEGLGCCTELLPRLSSACLCPVFCWHNRQMPRSPEGSLTH